jgi:hypothetical protein
MNPPAVIVNELFPAAPHEQRKAERYNRNHSLFMQATSTLLHDGKENISSFIHSLCTRFRISLYF